MLKTPELSMVVPCFNEETNVKILAKKITKILKKSKIDYELILVDNGSVDNTQNEIKKTMKENKRITLVVVKKNIGYGNGILKGLKKASGAYVGYMWADDEVDPSQIPKMFKNMKNKYALCKITRYYRKDGIQRKVLSKGYNILFRVLFGVNSKDINGCPKIMKRDMYKKIKLSSKDWFIDAELMIKSKKANYEFLELPVEHKKRKSGKSNVRLSTTLEFIKNIFLYKLKNDF